MDIALDLFINLVFLLLLVGLTCLTASWTLLRGFKPRSVVLAGSATLALFFAGLFFLIQTAQKPEAVPVLQKYFDESWDQAAKMLTANSVSPENINTIKILYQKYGVSAFPAWLGVNCLAAGLLAYYLASAVLSRVSTKVSKAVAFREWMIPEPLVYGLILGALFKLVFKENSAMDIVGNNLLVFFVSLYTLGGLSIVSFFFNKWKFPPAIRILNYVVIFFVFNIIFESICFCCVLDIWFDFRKLKSPNSEPTATV